MRSGASEEMAKGQRFPFGRNWRAFLSSLNEERIRETEDSLKEMLDLTSLEGRKFLDIGSGSGIFSLAARNLGAAVHSFDYDPQSVACTRELKDRFFSGDDSWTVEQASVLDGEYLRSLGEFDVVYAWGVLHHTGNLHQAMGNATIPVAPRGDLFLAIYNDQGMVSRFWRGVKQFYNSGWFGNGLVRVIFLPILSCKGLLIGTIKHGNPLSYFSLYKKRRGMSAYHDFVDWLGGYPYEVASPEAVFRFYRSRGFSLKRLKTTNRLGCNQFVFRREDPDASGGEVEGKNIATAGR